MDDNNLKEAVCPMRSFGSSNIGLYGSDSQSQSQGDEKKDFFGTRDPTSFALSPLSVMMPKKYDENQDTEQTQDESASQDLHNGHNDKVLQRSVSISELEPVVDGEPDTEPMDGIVNNSESQGTTKEKDGLDNQVAANDSEKMDVDISEQKNVLENMEKENSKTVEESWRPEGLRKEEELERAEIGDNSMDTKHSEGTLDDSEGFNLHLTQTQSFMLVEEKSESPVNCESEENKPADGQLSKTTDKSDESAVKKVDSFDEQSNESDFKKMDSFDEQSNESDVKKIESSDEFSNKSDIKKIDSSDERSNGSEVKKVDSSDEKSNDTNDSSVKKDSSDDKSVELMEVVNPSEEIVKISSESEDTVEKAITPKKQVAFEDQIDSMEKEDSKAVSDSTNDVDALCSCVPACHMRLETVSQHLESACSQLEDFIKSKKRDDKKLLNNFLDMLKEIQCISDNKEVSGGTKISENVFSLEDTPKGGRKGGTKRKSNDLESPLKATPRKKIAEDKGGKPSEKGPIDFKDLKGLAVFAKWPNSGWYYPGIVEDLTAAEWKEVPNVTVKFYDGLVRDMKNINILPAYLIPSGSVLCDLEDETEMIVLSCEGSNQNSVDFKLSTKESPDTILDLNFNKLAIRANNMKSIKVQLEPTTDATPKNMHMVSLVSGRRSSRGRTKKDEDSEEKTEEKPKVERRSGTPKKAATPRRTRN